MAAWMRESSSIILKSFKMWWQHSFPTKWIQLIIPIVMAFLSGTAPDPVGRRGQGWLCPLALTCCHRCVKGGSLGCWVFLFVLFFPFFLLLKKWSLFKSTDGRNGGFWSSWKLLIPSSGCTEQIEAGRGFTEATWHCSSLYQHSTLFFWVQGWPFPSSLTFWKKAES